MWMILCIVWLSGFVVFLTFSLIGRKLEKSPAGQAARLQETKRNDVSMFLAIGVCLIWPIAICLTALLKHQENRVNKSRKQIGVQHRPASESDRRIVRTFYQGVVVNKEIVLPTGYRIPRPADGYVWKCSGDVFIQQREEKITT